MGGCGRPMAVLPFYGYTGFSLHGHQTPQGLLSRKYLLAVPPPPNLPGLKAGPAGTPCGRPGGMVSTGQNKPPKGTESSGAGPLELVNPTLGIGAPAGKQPPLGGVLGWQAGSQMVQSKGRQFGAPGRLTKPSACCPGLRKRSRSQPRHLSRTVCS